MNRFIFLLAAMLLASLAALPLQAAEQARPQKSAVKKGDSGKRVAKSTTSKPKQSAKAKPVTAPVNPYLAASTSLSAKTAPNPYLPGNDAPIVPPPNPYLPQAAAPAPAPAVQAAPAAAAVIAPALALSLSQSLANPPAAKVEISEPPRPPEPVKPVDQVVTVIAPPPAAYRTNGNPYLMYSYAYNNSSTMNFSNPLDGLGHTWSDIKNLLPSLPSSDMAILPTLKKVYPTGEKPLYVLTFKCPTEVVGITPIPTKALHWLVTAGMDAVNATDLLPFNMQQVCQ